MVDLLLGDRMTTKRYQIPGAVTFLFSWAFTVGMINVLIGLRFQPLLALPSFIGLYFAFRFLLGSLRSLWIAYFLTVLVSILIVIMWFTRELILLVFLPIGIFMPCFLLAMIIREELVIPAIIFIAAIDFALYFIIKIILKKNEVRNYFRIVSKN
jgi:hypothetical protein